MRFLLIDLPSIQSLHQQPGDELVTLKYLLRTTSALWSLAIKAPSHPRYAPPDVIIQVVEPARWSALDRKSVV